MSSPTPEQELLILAYWWQGPRHQAPEWVRKHALWPENNDQFHKDTCNIAGGAFATAQPGRDRLWEAINRTFKLGL